MDGRHRQAFGLELRGQPVHPSLGPNEHQSLARLTVQQRDQGLHLAVVRHRDEAVQGLVDGLPGRLDLVPDGVACVHGTSHARPTPAVEAWRSVLDALDLVEDPRLHVLLAAESDRRPDAFLGFLDVELTGPRRRGRPVQGPCVSWASPFPSGLATTVGRIEFTRVTD